MHDMTFTQIAETFDREFDAALDAGDDAAADAARVRSDLACRARVSRGPRSTAEAADFIKEARSFLLEDRELDLIIAQFDRALAASVRALLSGATRPQLAGEIRASARTASELLGNDSEAAAILWSVVRTFAKPRDIGQQY